MKNNFLGQEEQFLLKGKYILSHGFDDIPSFLLKKKVPQLNLPRLIQNPSVFNLILI